MKNKFLLQFFFFLALLCGMFVYLKVFEVLKKRPESTHVWAQCDRASVARNYAEESMNFFLPRVNETHEHTGITGLEFPFMNYSAAVCYKLFGFNELWYRLLMLIVFSSGAMAAFLMAEKFLKNLLLSASITMAWLLSPILLFYVPNFIPDTASLGFILLAWYFFFQHIQSSGNKNLTAFFITSTLSCLIKITSSISLLVMLCLVIIDQLKLLDKTKSHIIPRKKQLTISIILSFIMVAAWYKYAGWISDKYKMHVFLMSPNRVHNMEEFHIVLKSIKDLWFPFYYHSYVYKAMLWSGIVLLTLSFKANRLLLFATLGLWIGNASFVYFMLGQFRYHDYYIITLLPGVLFLFISAADSIKQLRPYKWIPHLLSLPFIFLIFHSAKYSRDHLEYRYNKDGWLYGTNKFSTLYSIEPYLRSIGVERMDKVVSLYDESPNISLYLMNVKGWRNQTEDSDENIIQNIKSGASYLIVNDSTALSREKLQPYFKNKIGQYKNVSVFKL